jgi:beta-glucosidase
MTARIRRLGPGVLVPAVAPLAAVLAAVTLLAAYRSGGGAEPAGPVAARVEELLSRMSLDDKIGQMTLVDRAALDPADDVMTYRIGGVQGVATAAGYDSLQRFTLTTPLRIPLLHSVATPRGLGGTVFPANIGLGASRDAELAQRVGRAMAEEIAAAGADWTFGPCLCVTRNDHWIGTPDSFGEKPEIANAMTSMVIGLQGTTLGAGSVLATATHYIGGGATADGVDGGDTLASEADLRAIHLAPFRSAVQRGVGAVRISNGGWNGSRLHAHHYLITEVLKRELGFAGVVVGDGVGLDAIDGQEGFTEAEVAATINAGVDMVVADDYRRFVSLLRSAVQSGRVGPERIDDATRRILTKKVELGLFERPFSDPGLAATVGSPAHRDVARDAVRRSVVLLKNADRLLPLERGAGKVFVAGGPADDLAGQSGGPLPAGTTGTTILAAVRAAAGGGVTYHRDGAGVNPSYRVGVVVVGEAPAVDGPAERSATLAPDPRDLAAADRIRAVGVPVVVVLVAGRPLDVTAHLRGWSALLAAWLPGTEGGGVADVLYGAHNPTARLPVTWMGAASQQPINDGDGKPPLFPYDFGLSYPTGPTPTGPDPTGGATATRPPTAPAPDRPAVCAVTYRLVNQWDVGFQADITIRNTGSAPVDGWRLVWTFGQGQRVTQLWGGEATARGDTVTVRNADWNGGLAPGATATVGFTASHRGRNPVPITFSLNGAPCVLR